jgi:hypothetical protein
MKCMGAMVLRFQMKIRLMPDILFFFNLYVNNYLYSEYENESSEKYFLNNFSDREKNLIFNNKFIKK